MIVVLLEASVTPGIQSFRNVHGLIVSQRLSADEPGALHHVEECQQRRNKPPKPRRRKSFRHGRRYGLSNLRTSHTGPAAAAGLHSTSAKGKVPPRPAWGQPPSAVQSSAARRIFCQQRDRGPLLRRTAEGARPHVIRITNTSH